MRFFMSLGIIPAYAGSTRTTSSPSECMRDHPRIRGEHGSGTSPTSPASGSSPHTRGALPEAGFELADVGIIPAYAGSTPSPRSSKVRFWDHPRIRGEHFGVFPFRGQYLGSSPHTRGALLTAVDVDGGGRIIPAYAGSTHSRSVARPGGRDHPRIRGEHEMGAVGSIFPSGSSPHTRGAPIAYSVYKEDDRIIPAYAGSTRPSCA